MFSRNKVRGHHARTLRVRSRCPSCLVRFVTLRDKFCEAVTLRDIVVAALLGVPGGREKIKPRSTAEAASYGSERGPGLFYLEATRHKGGQERGRTAGGVSTPSKTSDNPPVAWKGVAAAYPLARKMEGRR